MRATRLTFALQDGALTLPETGDIVVLRPRPADELSCLPDGRVVVVTGFRPDHDHFAALRYRTRPDWPEAAPAVSIVCLPRSREQARAMLAEASARTLSGGRVVVDGQKTDGIDGILKDLRGRVALSEPVAKAHGRLASFAAGADLSDWMAQDRPVEGGFFTRPGVFSADGPDRGSVLLAAALPEYFPGYVADLGAGWGYLAAAVLSRKGVRRVDLVEAEADALDCARRNITDPRARFVWADATTWRADGHADHVVMNPPFHTTREADPALGLAFLRAAHRVLSPKGTLWLVANRHLPYHAPLATLFREVEDIGGDAAFRLTRAALPVRAR